jgi:hypothetical protein
VKNSLIPLAWKIEPIVLDLPLALLKLALLAIPREIWGYLGPHPALIHRQQILADIILVKLCNILLLIFFQIFCYRHGHLALIPKYGFPCT